MQCKMPLLPDQGPQTLDKRGLVSVIISQQSCQWLIEPYQGQKILEVMGMFTGGEKCYLLELPSLRLE